MPEPIHGAFFHLPTLFQTQPCIFSAQVLNFRLRFSDHLSRPGSTRTRVKTIEGFVRVGGSLVHRALRASVFPRLLTRVVFISSDL